MATRKFSKNLTKKLKKQSLLLNKTIKKKPKSIRKSIKMRKKRKNNKSKKSPSKSSSKSSNEVTCSICFDEIDNKNETVSLKCNHIYHKKCIKPWCNELHRKNKPCTCPMCREKLEEKELKQLGELDLNNQQSVYDILELNDLTDPQEIARRNFSIIQARNQFLRERETIIPDEDLNNELQRIRSRIRELEERRNNLLQQGEYILHNRSTGTGKKTKKNRKKKGGAPKRKHDQLTEETLEKLPTKPIETKELLNKEPNDNEEELSRIEQEKELQQIRSLIEKSRASPLNIIKKKRSQSSLSNRSN